MLNRKALIRKAAFADDARPCPDYLAIGHITKDLSSPGYRIGGSFAYAAATARNLGECVGGVTSYAPDLQLSDVLSGVDVVVVPSDSTSTFENINLGHRRRQFIRSVATPIEPQFIPTAWRAAEIVHLAPVAQEVSAAIIDLFPRSFIGVTPQGWMRRWRGDGRVCKASWRDAGRVLPLASAVVLSTEDVLDGERTIASYARQARVLVATRGAAGADLFYGGATYHFPAWPAKEVDPTGAGDVFAAAFFIHLHRTGDPFQAMRVATCAASFAVEAVGLEGIPTMENLNHRLHGS